MSRPDTKDCNWVFTINNFTEDDIRRVEALGEHSAVHRLIAEKEHLEEATPHIQGYVSFRYAQYKLNVERLLGGRAYLEKARGGYKKNVEYCSKENNVFICVNCGESTKELTLDLLKKTRTMNQWEIRDRYPLIWFNNRNKIITDQMEEALMHVSNWEGDLKQKNIWLWGKAGVGKSSWAAKHVPFINQYKKPCNKWWDGFNCLIHNCVIIEDFPVNGQIFVQNLKIWSDRYFFMGECKGSTMTIEPGRFFLIITSNYPIDRCFEYQEDIEAIKRRFTEIEMTNENKTIINSIELQTTILKK